MPGERRLTYRAAVIEALAEEMRRDPNVVIIGEDVGAAGGVFRQTEGLFEEFGAKRVIDTPISESGAFGMAVGAAMMGLRPVFEVMFGDFMTLVMDQLVNQAAKIHYMSAGRACAPLVLRTTMGLGANLGPQHSQAFYAWAAHVPGLKVVAPATANDAKGLFKSAIRDDNPVLIFEDRLLYSSVGDVGSELVPIGKARTARSGRDITIVGVGRMALRAEAAASVLAEDGIEAEVIDLRSLSPLDTETLIESVKRTNRALVVDNAPRAYGAASEIAMAITEQAFDWLDAPVARLAWANVPVPVARSLEPLVAPDEAAIIKAARDLLGRS
jgi:acetoin:2,6-dichlorophenolindophenol oxidoreductase subunit beta